LRELNEVAGRAVAPPLVRIVSIVLKGDNPVGTEVKVRSQFVPSPLLAKLIPMTRGGDVVGTLGAHTKKTAAKTPARTTTIATTRTTTMRARFSDAGGGGGANIIPCGAGIVPGTTDPGNGVPHWEQNRFAGEFGAPQRGQTAVADVQTLQPME
jgi:hypothetical protein